MPGPRAEPVKSKQAGDEGVAFDGVAAGSYGSHSIGAGAQELPAHPPLLAAASGSVGDAGAHLSGGAPGVQGSLGLGIRFEPIGSVFRFCTNLVLRK